MEEEVKMATSGHKNACEKEDKTNWSLCCICQKKVQGHLVDPANVKRFNKGNSYKLLEERLIIFKDLNALPSTINNIDRLDDGSGISCTLTSNKARWHKQCFDMFNGEKMKRILKRKDKEEHTVEHSPAKKLLRSVADVKIKNCCFFCDQPEGSSGLFHRVETLSLDSRIRKLATEMKDSKILAKLAAGDMAATDSVYHKNCLTMYNNKYRSFCRKSLPVCSTTNELHANKATAFAELVAYVEKIESSDGKDNRIFKLSELNRMFTNRLQQLGTSVTSNSSHLKEKLLSAVPSLEEHKSTYETMLSFREDIGNTLLEARRHDIENDALVLMRAANIVRKDIFKHTYQFRGSLQDKQYDDIPESLSKLVDMILNGRDISNETESEYNSCEIQNSLAQLIMFNTRKRRPKDVSYHRHLTERETMLPLYLGLLIHGKTRKRELIDILHERGLSISYDRVLQISTDIANSVITQFEEAGVVCPSFFQDNVFMTGNLDNIDYNPSSNTSRDSFHGTAISITQHYTETEMGSPVVFDTDLSAIDPKKTKHLPDKYTEVPPVSLKNKSPPPTKRPVVEVDNSECTMSEQIEWLEHTSSIVNSGTLNKNEFISWSGYFASKQTIDLRPPAMSALLPLFRDEAHSVAMVKHGMQVIREATAFKNAGQSPVLTVDQPLYTIAKKIQWTWPLQFGEDKYVILMGGLHIEMALLKSIGEWLDGSGWLSALTTANILTPGRAEVVQRGANTARGQWIHQVMAASLYTLQRRAYTSYTDTMTDDPTAIKPFPEWCDASKEKRPQFEYWDTTLKLELLFLQFLKAQREANFVQYKQTLSKLLPWLFALDHVHYARWLSIHIQDLENLELDCPDVYREFTNGKFVTQKSTRTFSCIAHDQVHEQLNVLIKGDGGFVGITESPETLNRWTVSSPEITRILSEVETGMAKQNKSHHEQNRSSQDRFLQHTQSLVAAMEELGNPFTEDSSDLIALDTKMVLTEEAVKSVKHAEKLGKDQYKSFVAECIYGDGSVYDPIKKNNLVLFKSGTKCSSSKNAARVRSMKSDIQLFSRMYISCQSRDGDIDTFFEHENHPWPPSLAEMNNLRSGNKSDLVTCLETNIDRSTECPDVDVRILDGAAIVQVLDPKKGRVQVQTFGEYAVNVFLPFIYKHLYEVDRVEVIWDTYKQDSLKSFTRQMRGSGDHVRFSDTTKLPANWKSFLRNDKNKTQLFHFLAQSLRNMEIQGQKSVITTYDETVLCSKNTNEDHTDLAPCNHEEADTRMLLHAANAFRQGKKSVLIYATDADVAVIAIALASLYKECSLWLGYGHASSFRYIPIHELAQQLGPDASWALLFFHAFTGCDTVSYFNSIGKKSAFKFWQSQHELIPLFKKLSVPVESISEDDIIILERFVVLLYSKTAACDTVSDARKYLFSQKNRQIENIPPSKSALIQHIKRAVYQAGHVWGQMTSTIQELPSPSNWGWYKDDSDVWKPVWSTLPEASKGCRELVKCNCKTACAGRCKCFKANLTCTLLCSCQAGCDRA